MYQLVYLSSATSPMPDQELLELLTTARTNNSALDVTGLLLYHDGNFIQVLEGPQRVVVPLYQKIEQDPRHRGLMVLLQGPTSTREFDEWSMGFANVHKIAPEKLEGVSDFLQNGFNINEFVGKPTRIKMFLNTFHEFAT